MSKQLFATVASAICLVALSACGKSEKPSYTYMPDMAYQPSFKAQEGEMRMPVKGTVPREFNLYPYANDPELAGKELKNPLQPTAAVLARGKVMYETFCLVCHGPAAEGDGSIVPKFPRPPTLHSDKVRTWTDGRIFHVLTIGQNLMPTYATQIQAVDRWAIIHYVRTLQRAKNPTPDDLKAAAGSQ